MRRTLSVWGLFAKWLKGIWCCPHPEAWSAQRGHDVARLASHDVAPDSQKLGTKGEGERQTRQYTKTRGKNSPRDKLRDICLSSWDSCSLILDTGDVQHFSFPQHNVEGLLPLAVIFLSILYILLRDTLPNYFFQVVPDSTDYLSKIYTYLEILIQRRPVEQLNTDSPHIARQVVRPIMPQCFVRFRLVLNENQRKRNRGPAAGRSLGTRCSGETPRTSKHLQRELA